MVLPNHEPATDSVHPPAARLHALRIKEDKSGCVSEAINRCKFASGCLLNIQADDQNFVFEFLFKPINDGAYLGAGQSIR